MHKQLEEAKIKSGQLMTIANNMNKEATHLLKITSNLEIDYLNKNHLIADTINLARVAAAIDDKLDDVIHLYAEGDNLSKDPILSEEMHMLQKATDQTIQQFSHTLDLITEMIEDSENLSKITQSFVLYAHVLGDILEAIEPIFHE